MGEIRPAKGKKTNGEEVVRIMLARKKLTATKAEQIMGLSRSSISQRKKQNSFTLDFMVSIGKLTGHRVAIIPNDTPCVYGEIDIEITDREYVKHLEDSTEVSKTSGEEQD